VGRVQYNEEFGYALAETSRGTFRFDAYEVGVRVSSSREVCFISFENDDGEFQIEVQWRYRERSKEYGEELTLLARKFWLLHAPKLIEEARQTIERVEHLQAELDRQPTPPAPKIVFIGSGARDR
jgi:hypothetical protein